MSDSITSLPQPRPSNDSSGASSAPSSSASTSGASRSSTSGGGPSGRDGHVERVDVASIDIDTLDEEALSRLPSGQQEAVKKLHTQVARAVMAIESLKDENRRLRRRVEELEKRPAVSDDETVLTLPGDPESLRDTLNHFIDAIDAYLEGESVSGDGAGDGVAAASGGE